MESDSVKIQVETQRGSTICRACGSDKLVEILDLGLQPLPAEYGSTPDEVLETFPLLMRKCQDCGLGQLGEYVLPERIFHKNYPYLSSASSTWVAHAKNYALQMKEQLSLNENDLVVELASNDGYLLSEFKKLGIPVLGVEPAANVASMAIASGVPTICEFFGAELAHEILEKYGHPKLIIANNVFAHIPDMIDFTKGMAILAGENTLITIENPSFTTLMKKTLFDTIYHEHYSYISSHAVKKIAGNHGLSLVHIDSLPTHGGSNRYWLSKSLPVDETVTTSLEEERQDGLFETGPWQDFAVRAKEVINGLRKWLLERKLAGDVVAGYGAAHKGNTFLNSVGEAAKSIVYVVDASIEKQGKFLPGSQIPVLAPDMLDSKNPTDVLILPWNIAPELKSQIQKLAPNARIWVAHPEMHQL
jgi:hypothetical protein